MALKCIIPQKDNQAVTKTVLTKKAEYLSVTGGHIVRTALAMIAAVMKTTITVREKVVVMQNGVITEENSVRERVVTAPMKKVTTKKVNADAVCIQVTVLMREFILIQMKTMRMSVGADMILDAPSLILCVMDIQITVIEILAGVTLEGKEGLRARITQKRTGVIKSFMILNWKGRWVSSLTKILRAQRR